MGNWVDITSPCDLVRLWGLTEGDCSVPTMSGAGAFPKGTRRVA